MYFFFFLITSLLAWVASAFGADIANAIYRNSMPSSFWPSSAYKITLAFTVFHLLFGLAVIGVKDAHSTRGAIHNGWWGPKFIVWLGLIVGFMFLPTPGFLVVYPWISLAGSVVFTLIQLFMLVDFAHSWNEAWVAKYHETNNKNWFWILLSATVVLLLLSLVMTILMLVFLRFGGDDCPYNALNLGLTAAGTQSSKSAFGYFLCFFSSLLSRICDCCCVLHSIGSACNSEPQPSCVAAYFFDCLRVRNLSDWIGIVERARALARNMLLPQSQPQ